jgi:LL-diaminopimelate aminotransferase
VYRQRRDIVIQGLRSLGWQVEPPRATIYVWVQVPSPYTSTEFAELVLEKAGVVLTPGIGYGAAGEGWFRISLTISTERLKEAFDRLKKAFKQ